ncbi:chorion class B protein PC10-like [Vanessa tameamea]|uniref:Chorion class B protein PC10-like n=1 Tax=Vanessa tameamea TaxID=334116 RepID=A0A8B8I0K4_VANTA|nr:chorion class B protein PC10-like [Vanessa tameamea]
MSANCSVVLCLIALLVQNISSQCIGAYNGYADGFARENILAREAPLLGAYAAAPCAVERGLGYGPANLAASNGGGLAVTSASPIAPTGIAMTSENAYEGVLAVTGALPFLAAVSLEGVLPTAGAGAVTYSCGNGNVAILNEEIAAPGYIGGLGYAGPAYNGFAGPLGYEAGIAGPAYGFGYGGCGCGPIY